ncbi:MAG: autotransporter-associated beta strand repeat-containing protein, partial [Planctomycetia bacterium]
YQDSLDVSASTGNPLVAATGFSGLAASAGGATKNNLVVAIGTGTAGSLNSTLALSLVSNANGVAGLSNGTATVVGSPGAITTTGTVFTGQSTWNTNGGGEWGTLASNFGTNWNWSAFDGSPGVDAGFTNTDTATFGSALTSGTATVTVTAATPSMKSITFNNGAAAYAVTGVSGGSLALLNAGTTAASVTVAAGSHAISLPVALGSSTSLDIAAESLLTMAGVVSGANGIAKIGVGTTILSGNNTYGGTTTVAAGRLLIHGNQTAATGAITVEAGATLGGRGAAGGAVTVLSGGTLSPGASVESLAVGATTLSGTSTFFYELDSSAALSAGADLLVSNGNLTIESGSILEFTDLASSPTAFAQGTKFSLISYGTSSWNSGLFTFAGDVLANGDTFTAGLNQWQIRYDDPTGGSNFTADQLAGNSVTIMAVPEPGTLALLAVGAVAGIAAKRSRRKAA